ncbi:MAG TPA: hypothetical protein VMS93_08640 [Candidatus Saccharimonadales bacterium]|nr:hypothetical protein [Candidatus Saccharimonadales bacterium]
MTKLLKTLFIVGVVCVLAASLASAGQNSGASAQLYWLSGSASNSTALPSRNYTGNNAIVEVTLKGSLGFKGEDIQLLINGLDHEGVGDMWNGNCGNYTCPAVSGTYTYAKFTYPDVFFASPACTGVLVAQTAATPVWHSDVNPCLAPNSTALIWLQAAAGVGKARVATTEYGAIGLKFIMSGYYVPADPGPPPVPPGCPGGNDDPAGPVGICIAPNWRQPCHDTAGGSRIMQTVDVSGKGDFVPYASGFEWLTWHGELEPGSPPNPCWLVTPAKTTTWGQIKRMYH